MDNLMENNLFELSSDSILKLDDDLELDRDKLFSDTQSLDNLTASFLTNSESNNEPNQEATTNLVNQNSDQNLINSNSVDQNLFSASVLNEFTIDHCDQTVEINNNFLFSDNLDDSQSIFNEHCYSAIDQMMNNSVSENLKEKNQGPSIMDCQEELSSNLTNIETNSDNILTQKNVPTITNSNTNTPLSTRRSRRQIEKSESDKNITKDNAKQESKNQQSDQLNQVEMTDSSISESETMRSTNNNELKNVKNKNSTKSPRLSIEQPIIERVSTRPQRQRKLPKRFEDDNIEVTGIRRLSNVTSAEKNKSDKKTKSESKQSLVKLPKHNVKAEEESIARQIKFSIEDEIDKDEKISGALDEEQVKIKLPDATEDVKMNEEDGSAKSDIDNPIEKDSELPVMSEVIEDKKDSELPIMNEEIEDKVDEMIEDKVDEMVQDKKDSELPTMNEEIEDKVDEMVQDKKDSELPVMNEEIEDKVDEMEQDKKDNELPVMSEVIEERADEMIEDKVDEMIEDKFDEMIQNKNSELMVEEECIDKQIIEPSCVESDHNKMEIEFDSKTEDQNQKIDQDEHEVQNDGQIAEETQLINEEKITIEDQQVNKDEQKNEDQNVSVHKEELDDNTNKEDEATNSDKAESSKEIETKSSPKQSKDELSEDIKSKKNEKKTKSNAVENVSAHKLIKKPTSTIVLSAQNSKRSVIKPPIKDNTQTESSDEEIDEADQEWSSDDDPDKLWCICRKPHGNKFMIECDLCKEWFHGSCVGITRTQIKQYDNPLKKWFCKKCREEQQNDRKLLPDKKVFKDKNKLQSFTKQKSFSNLDMNKLKSLGNKDLAKRKSLGNVELKVPKSLDNNRSKFEERRKLSLDSQEHVHKKLKKLSSESPLKTKLSRSHSIDEEESRLKKLIKNSKTDLNKKIITKLDRKSPSLDRSSSLDSTTQDKVLSESMKDQSKSKDDKKKKSLSSQDPFIDDLFKPTEPVIVQKTKKLSSIKRSDSISSDIISSPFSNCVYRDCDKQVQKINGKESVYCSRECVKKHVEESILLITKIRLSNAKTNLERKSVREDNKKVVLVDKKTGKYLSGGSAIEEDKILDYVLNNPTFEIPSIRKQSTNDLVLSSNSKKLQQISFHNSSSVHKDKSMVKESASSKATTSTKETETNKEPKTETEDIRHNVVKQLKKAFYSRLENCKDLQMERNEVKKIAIKIEDQLFDYFKDVNKNYKNKFRSLLFNLKDEKNEVLFKKVLKKELKPDKLIRMSSEDLARKELAEWRERENRHSIEMIKKDAEQQASQVVVKKTHKGEEVIKQKVQIPVFEEVKKLDVTPKEDKPTPSSTVKSSQSSSSTASSIAAKVVSAKEKSASNPLDLLFRDTTEEHGQHLFDLHCKICNNQTKEDLSLVHKPKPLSTFEKNRLLEEAELIEKRAKAELNNIDKLINESSNSSSSNLDLKQLNDEPLRPKTIHSCWNGYIHMQEVSKFIAFAYKVSGAFEAQDILDSIQVCGRLAPEQVYYYVEKLKAASRNDITILKFIPANDDEKVGYEQFFKYLHTRNRFGVVGNSGKAIKDFYIFPLARDQDMHESLQSFNGVGIEEKNARPNYLLGLLVRARKHHIPDHHQHHSSKSDHHHLDKSMHYSPNTSTKVASVTPPINESHHQKRSYTPPPRSLSSENSNSNSMDDVSYTPPRKDKHQDEPYDPEESLGYKAIKKQKIDHKQHSSEQKESAEEIKSTTKSSPTKNLVNLLEHLSKNSKLYEKGLTFKMLLNEIGKTITNEQQHQLLEELTRKIEESEKQLEIKRKATENAFSQAASSNKFDSNYIPGLDGDFGTVEESKEEKESSILIPKDLEIPDSLKEFIEKFSDLEDVKKTNILDDDPIVKNYGGLSPADLNEGNKSSAADNDTKSNKKDQIEDESEPMELDEEVNNTNTIIEVNDPNQFNQSTENIKDTEEEELVKKAKKQLDVLKAMEEEQKRIIAEQNKKTKSQSTDIIQS